VTVVVHGLESLSDKESSLARGLIRALSEGLAKRGRPLKDVLVSASASKASQLFAELLAAARKSTADEKQPLKPRVEAIHTLALGSFGDAQPLLIPLLTNRQPQEIQLAALETLSQFKDAGVTKVLLEAWPTLGPRVRGQAAEALFARNDRLVGLLDAVESGTIPSGDLDPARLKLLASHSDTKIRDRAAKLLSGLQLGKRQDVVNSYRPALQLTGEPARGKVVFGKICAACHKAEGVGHEIGPNLATVQNRGAETILLNVLDPSREVNPQYLNYVMITDDGRAITGMISAETATSVTLKRAEGLTDTVLRSNIEELRSTGQSIMPEGVEKQVDHQQMADLIAYLLSLK
jgi:putative heme-binding domain-containing protein